MISVRKSVDINSLDPEKSYFNPGCAMCVYKPDNPGLIREMLKEHFGDVSFHNICCHHDPNLPEGSVIINNCAGCDRRFRSLYPGVDTISLWEVLDSFEDLKIPDHNGLTVSVHDSCSYRHKPQVHAAVRSLLQKMNIEIIETEFSGTRSVCCGDNYYGHVPNEQVEARMKERADQFPCEYVVVTCIGCVHAMTIGGKKPLYMPDLILGHITEPATDTLDEYHAKVNAYTEAH